MKNNAPRDVIPPNMMPITLFVARRIECSHNLDKSPRIDLDKANHVFGWFWRRLCYTCPLTWSHAICLGHLGRLALVQGCIGFDAILHGRLFLQRSHRHGDARYVARRCPLLWVLQGGCRWGLVLFLFSSPPHCQIWRRTAPTRDIFRAIEKSMLEIFISCDFAVWFLQDLGFLNKGKVKHFSSFLFRFLLKLSEPVRNVEISWSYALIGF